jgi:hypothetical protein
VNSGGTTSQEEAAEDIVLGAMQCGAIGVHNSQFCVCRIRGIVVDMLSPVHGIYILSCAMS